MEMDHYTCYRALRTRDRRFDGRFFTAVTSTGVYCRPICPARTPRPDHCEFYSCAAAAEDAGFRPCRRCRPESAPGTPAWLGTSATVARALRLIERGALDQADVVTLAARLGVGDRHLRRLFADQLGTSPRAVARTRRVHLAKRLIEETNLPISQIAVSTGYHNVRRFNAAIRGCFDRTPTEIRSQARSARSRRSDEGSLVVTLPYREPLDWHGLLDFLSPRAIPGVEAVDGGVYRRRVEFGDATGLIEVRLAGNGAAALDLRVPIDLVSHVGKIVPRVRALFDLDADPTRILGQLASDRRLESLTRRFPGQRVPGAWSPFEMAVRAILGQQVTVAAATRQAGRLVEAFGRTIEGASPPNRLFPSAAVLARASFGGMPKSRSETIRALARSVRDGEPVLDLAPELETTIARLTRLPGIGDWTANYVAMRALGEPDAFPAGDLWLRRALSDGDDLPDVRTVRYRAEAWRPWRAYAAMLLWRLPPSNPNKEKP